MASELSESGSRPCPCCSWKIEPRMIQRHLEAVHVPPQAAPPPLMGHCSDCSESATVENIQMLVDHTLRTGHKLGKVDCDVEAWKRGEQQRLCTLFMFIQQYYQSSAPTKQTQDPVTEPISRVINRATQDIHNQAFGPEEFLKEMEGFLDSEAPSPEPEASGHHSNVLSASPAGSELGEGPPGPEEILVISDSEDSDAGISSAAAKNGSRSPGKDCEVDATTEKPGKNQLSNQIRPASSSTSGKSSAGTPARPPSGGIQEARSDTKSKVRRDFVCNLCHTSLRMPVSKDGGPCWSDSVQHAIIHAPDIAGYKCQTCGFRSNRAQVARHLRKLNSKCKGSPKEDILKKDYARLKNIVEQAFPKVKPGRGPNRRFTVNQTEQKVANEEKVAAESNKGTSEQKRTEHEQAFPKVLPGRAIKRKRLAASQNEEKVANEEKAVGESDQGSSSELKYTEQEGTRVHVYDSSYWRNVADCLQFIDEQIEALKAANQSEGKNVAENAAKNGEEKASENGEKASEEPDVEPSPKRRRKEQEAGCHREEANPRDFDVNNDWLKMETNNSASMHFIDELIDPVKIEPPDSESNSSVYPPNREDQPEEPQKLKLIHCQMCRESFPMPLLETGPCPTALLRHAAIHNLTLSLFRCEGCGVRGRNPEELEIAHSRVTRRSSYPNSRNNRLGCSRRGWKEPSPLDSEREEVAMLMAAAFPQHCREESAHTS